MAINRFLKNLLVEIVLCFTIAILAGHFTANFLERYVVQKELSNMKDNLRRLKFTVNHIGNAYDNLHNELIGLAGKNQPNRPLPRHHGKTSNQHLDTISVQTLPNEIIKEADDERNWKPIKQREMGIMSNSYNEIDNNKTNVSAFEIESDQGPNSKRKYSTLKNSHEPNEYYKRCGCYYD